MPQTLPPGAVPVTYSLFQKNSWEDVDAAVVEETAVCIHVNGQELATLMATPSNQEALAVGFLAAEGFIDSLDDIELIELSHSGACVDVWLKREFVRPERTIITSGCGGGITFDDLTAERSPLPSSDPIAPNQIVALYRQLRSAEVLYPITRGIHASAICTADTLLLATEDVGRHNTLDKSWGLALLKGIETKGRIIITTGRISSEMLGKAAKMGAPVIASRTSPTSRSVALAQAWNITIVGYLRQGNLRVYSTAERIDTRPVTEASTLSAAAPSA